MGAWPSSSPTPSAGSPSTPPPARTRCPRTSRCWRPTRRPSPRCPASSPPRKALEGANRYPDPTNAALRRALSDRYGVRTEHIAIGNGSCDILLAAGEALLEPGAELVYAWPSFSVYPHLAAASGATAITVALDDDAHATTSTRWPRRSPPRRAWSSSATRTTRRRPRSRRRHRRVRGEGAAPRLPDRRRGLLRVQHARRPGRDARPAQAPPEPRAAADVLEGLRALRPARRLRAVRLRGARHGGRPGAPAVLLQRRRPGRRDRGAQAPGRGHRARRAQRRGARRARRRARALGHRARRVAGELRPGSISGEARAASRGGVVPALAGAACSSAPARRWAARVRCA